MGGGFNVATRSPQSRLFDNIGRRIRHINADLKKNPDAFREAGLKRQKANLEEFRDELRQRAKQNGGKLTQDQINDATYEMKTNENLTTDKKKIDDITRKMATSEQDDFYDDFDADDIDDLINSFDTELSGKYIGQSGDSEMRLSANIIADKAIEYSGLSTITEEQRLKLNNIVRSIGSALSSKGASGVVYPLS